MIPWPVDKDLTDGLACPVPALSGHSNGPNWMLKRLFKAYDRHLQGMAESARTSRRQNVLYAAMFPWTAGVAVLVFATEAIGMPEPIQRWVVLSLALLAAVGGGYAAFRVSHHGWHFDRTPPPGEWTQTANGQVLIQALRRVSLNGLSGVTPSTRIREDLKLTAADVSALVEVLTAGRPDAGPAIQRARTGSMTVQSLLDAMSTP